MEGIATETATVWLRISAPGASNSGSHFNDPAAAADGDDDDDYIYFSSYYYYYYHYDCYYYQLFFFFIGTEGILLFDKCLHDMAGTEKHTTIATVDECHVIFQ